jgi:TonB-linked SusC/RagA family outer membrane protein
MRSLLQKAALGLLACFLVPGLALAQEQTVRGTVSDAETGEPLAGATVRVMDTNIGTAADAQGRYELEAPSGDATLVFSFVGYATREVPIEGRTVVDVALSPQQQQLEDVVVVGFGEKQAQEVTGSISSVSADEIEDAPVTSFEEALQGRTPGVQITNSSGKLGQGIRVRIRGNSSITGDNQPLYVIDGVPLDNTSFSTNDGATNPLAQLNPNDIESIDVLKDASATAIYGARGSNGVIQITTKTGASGGSQFTFNMERGWSGPTNTPEFLDAEEYVNYYLEAARNSSIVGEAFIRDYFDSISRGIDWRPAMDGNPIVDEDWQEKAFQDDPTSLKVNMSARGGDEATTFFISGLYSQQEGLLNRDTYDKISARANVDHSFTEAFRIGTRLNLNRVDNTRVSDDNSFGTPIQLVAQPPISPAFVPSTNVATNEDGYLTEYRPTDELNKQTLYFNNLLYNDNVRWNEVTYRAVGSTFLEYDALESLTLRSEFGLDLRTQNSDQYFNSETFQNVGTDQGLGVQTWDRIVNYNFDATAQYDDTFGEVHEVSGTGGLQLQSSTTNGADLTGEQFPNDSFTQLNSAGQLTAGGGYETGYRFLAGFARASYRYDDTYLLEASARYEGSSRFGIDNRYGFFPTFSAGWVLTEESFVPTGDVLSYLKVRGSIGLAGNAGIDNFAWQGLFGASSYAGRSGINPSQTPNPALQWEQTREINVGLDYELLNSRITGSIDAYQKTTNELLLDVNVPATTGFLTQTRNVGTVKNRGLEFLVQTQNLTGDFSWRSNFNISFNRNEATDLNGQVIRGGFVNQAREGEPIGVFYALEYAGVDPQDGDALFYVNEKDENGNVIDAEATTDNANEANRVVIGNPNPAFTGGFGNTFEYKGFELRTLFSFDYGSEIFAGGDEFKAANGRFRDNQHVSQLDAWSEPGDQTDVPEPRLFENNGAQESSRYLYDGSYLRLRNVTLSYNLSTRLAQRLSANSARIYVSGANLLTFTDYRWWDPEVNADYVTGNVGFGNEFYTAPQARSITGGIQFSF